MPTISISKYVDIDIDLDDVNSIDLAKALVNKKDYLKALDEALTGKQTNQSEYEDFDQVKELIEAFRCKKPIEPIIASIAYNNYGLVV